MSTTKNIQVGSVEYVGVVFIVRCCLCGGQRGVVEGVVLKHSAADPPCELLHLFLDVDEEGV